MKLSEGDYCIRLVDLPGDVHGAVMLENDGFANIYINAKLSPEARRLAVQHEIKHLEENDFYNDKTIEEAEGF